MKNFFANVYKYPVEGDSEMRRGAMYFLRCDFKELYRIYNSYGDCNLLTTLYLQLQGKLSILWNLDIITEDEWSKLWNYTRLFSGRYNLTF